MRAVVFAIAGASASLRSGSRRILANALRDPARELRMLNDRASRRLDRTHATPRPTSIFRELRIRGTARCLRRFRRRPDDCARFCGDYAALRSRSQTRGAAPNQASVPASAVTSPTIRSAGERMPPCTARSSRSPNVPSVTR